MTATSDELALESRVDGAIDVFRFRTADGVYSKASFRDADRALLDALWDESLGRLLCPQANYGVVGTVLGETADEVLMTEASARAARLCERNAASNGVDARVEHVDRFGNADRAYDAAAYAPKPYVPNAVGERRIVDALVALRPGGKLYLAASERAGLGRYEDVLSELADDVRRVFERDGWTVLRAERPPAFSAPDPVERRTLRPTVDGVDLELVSEPGLFSAGGLDHGTRALLEASEIADGERVLDLCCGYGPIGVYAALVADCEVWLTDDDRRATACAERSLDASGVSGSVVTADCLWGVAEKTFDRVLCNPPTHAGSGVLDALLGGVPNLLTADGVLRLVHHRTLDLDAHLTAFDDVRTVEKRDEYVVLEAVP